MLRLKGAYSWIKITAVLLLLGGAGWLYSSQLAKQEVQFVTQQDVQIDTLTDGTIVTLNKRSLLRYPDRFEDDSRHVWLTKGEACFEVKPVKQTPFYITVASTTIKADSGTFNVRKLGGRVEVISETGRLELNRNGKDLIIGPGEKSVLKQNNSDLFKEKNTDQLYKYYRNNEFVTDRTPLPQLLKVLNEAFDSNIIIRRKKLNMLKINGTYKGTSADSILETISHTYRIRIERKQNKIFLH